MSKKVMPWQYGVLADWSICGMNHYHMKGERLLFVSMTKEGLCITEEGKDDQYLWNRLWHKAMKIAETKRSLTKVSKPKLTIEFYDIKGVHLLSVPARASLGGYWSSSTYLFHYGYVEHCVDGAIVGGHAPCSLPWAVA